MFRRRDPRSYSRAAREALWPRGGWTRAVTYMKHRLRRLPDPPEVVARGVAAGIFASFTPFYGLHFIVAALLARAVRGNVIAALLGTFFGNPLTYLPIAYAALTTGHFLLARGGLAQMEAEGPRSIFGRFSDAGEDLWHNVVAIFTPDVAAWDGLAAFWDSVFLPYLVGGVLPGLACAVMGYWLCLPAIAAYQKARRSKLAAKLAALRDKAKAAKDAKAAQGVRPRVRPRRRTKQP